MPRKLVLCRSAVKRNQIKREVRDGQEHIVITSYTLPPNIVMNGGLYPEDEVEKSYLTLNRTLAPVEHPSVNGQYISATDPLAINNFYAGAWNENARKEEDGRIAVDKVVNVAEAIKTERGKRLVDRVQEIEANENPRPIHTSVGVFVSAETLEQPQTNEAGDEYSWIASDMHFDHDAILLDSVGAATPEKGVGIGVNGEGQLDVEFAVCSEEEQREPADMRTNQDLSFSQISEKLHNELRSKHDDSWLIEVYDDSFIYETYDGELFRSAYNIDDMQNITISDTRLPVKRVVEYRETVTLNDENEENAMRDAIIAALTQMGITVNAELSDAELLAKYNEALAANKKDDGGLTLEQVKSVISDAVSPLSEEITSIKSELQANTDAEIDQLAQVVVNSDNYKGMSLEQVKSLGLETVKSMAANCQIAYGLGSTTLQNNTSDDSGDVSVSVDDLPE